MIVFYIPLYFFIVCCNLSFFISNFVDLILLSFFLNESGQRLVNFVYILKESAFGFINLCYCFFHFFFTYFCSDLYDFFPSANFGDFLFFFSVVLHVRICSLFEVFLFLEVGLYCYKLPSENYFCCIP